MLGLNPASEIWLCFNFAFKAIVAHAVDAYKTITTFNPVDYIYCLGRFMFAKARTVFLRKTFTLLIWLRLDFLVAILLVIASKAYFSNGKKNAPKVLHFIPKTAFIDDLEAIFGRNDNSIQLRSFNREFLLALTSPYFSKGRNEYNFINVETAEDDISIQKRLSNILQYFTMMTNTSGFITCAYNYCEQRDLAKIARKMGLSFIALHKECITTPYTRAVSRNLIYKTQVGQFWGSLLLTYNEDERRSITQAGGNYKAIAIGCPRADNYFTSGDYGSPTNSNNQENLDIDLLFFHLAHSATFQFIEKDEYHQL